ncbi:MAG TPA: hypothetical protein VEC16_06895 [Alphaproteobacteria bacterium]|nr:hypothetical protein [Alphaproteobacteria bacterium]
MNNNINLEMKLRKKNFESEVVSELDMKSYSDKFKDLSAEIYKYASLSTNLNYTDSDLTDWNYKGIYPNTPQELFAFSSIFSKYNEFSDNKSEQIRIAASLVCGRIIYNLLEAGYGDFNLNIHVPLNKHSWNLKGKKINLNFFDLIEAPFLIKDSNINYYSPLKGDGPLYSGCNICFHEKIECLPMGDDSIFNVKKAAERLCYPEYWGRRNTYVVNDKIIYDGFTEFVTCECSEKEFLNPLNENEFVGKIILEDENCRVLCEKYVKAVK